MGTCWKAFSLMNRFHRGRWCYAGCQKRFPLYPLTMLILPRHPTANPKRGFQSCFLSMTPFNTVVTVPPSMTLLIMMSPHASWIYVTLHQRYSCMLGFPSDAILMSHGEFLSCVGFFINSSFVFFWGGVYFHQNF